MYTICLLLLFLPGPPEKTPPEPARSAKIQTILVLQDHRLGADPRLTDFLSDSDDVVRERALLACANLQDTLLLPRLLERLHDGAAAVQEAAAFAIGQTGSRLSPAGQAKLETEVLDLGTLEGSPPRLLEEVGKFGSASGLSRLILLAPKKRTRLERDALVMGIARFAIRGIASDDAARFLIELARQPASVSWHAVYALQRLAPRSTIDVRVVLVLARHQDPLVRMNAATLLGKLGDTLGSATTLVRLSAQDSDWRVRVNATKAMGMLGGSPAPPVIRQFLKAFSATNEHVALSAMAAFGDMLKGTGSIPEEQETELWKIAETVESPLTIRRQAEAFLALAKIERSRAYERLARIHPLDEWLRARYLAALGMTGDTLALPHILRDQNHKNPLVASSVLEGLQHLAELNPHNHSLLRVVTGSAVRGLESRDISVLSTAASILADSAFRTPAAVPVLLRTLQGLHEPGDTEAMQQVIQTLGALHDTNAVATLLERLAGSDRTVAESAAAALQEITGRSYRDSIHVRLTSVPTREDSVFLARLSDTVLVRMQCSEGALLLELYPNVAPYTVMSFLKLAARDFFNGLRFHRVVPNFVVQGGDPRGDGWGGPGYSIRSEFSPFYFERGTLGMASAGKDTEGSQFFITHSPQPHLDGRYTIFGKVRDGMDVVDRLQVGDLITRVTVVP